MQGPTVGPSRLLGFEALGPQLVALIWEGVEPVGEGSLPQEVGGLELSLEGGNPTLPSNPTSSVLPDPRRKYSASAPAAMSSPAVTQKKAFPNFGCFCQVSHPRDQKSN